MPYLVLLGLLALVLAPASMARAEEDIMGPPAPPSPSQPEQVALPEDYPEDFSTPEPLLTARNRYEAFGEEEEANMPLPAPLEPIVEPAP